jgi:hypothetical protein
MRGISGSTFYPSEIPQTHPRRGYSCHGAECSTLVLDGRFCDGCFADAAKECARQIEALLLRRGFVAGSDELGCALGGGAALMDAEWFRHCDLLGEISFLEARRLQFLTDAACLLVVRGGVAALDILPGTRDPSGAARPKPKKGVCDFAAIPDRFQQGNVQETRFQAVYALVLFAIAVLLVIC